jgi:hypothetical protein
MNNTYISDLKANILRLFQSINHHQEVVGADGMGSWPLPFEEGLALPIGASAILHKCSVMFQSILRMAWRVGGGVPVFPPPSLPHTASS